MQCQVPALSHFWTLLLPAALPALRSPSKLASCMSPWPPNQGYVLCDTQSPTNTHDASLNRISYGRMLMFPELCNIAESCLSMAFCFLG